MYDIQSHCQKENNLVSEIKQGLCLQNKSNGESLMKCIMDFELVSLYRIINIKQETLVHAPKLWAETISKRACADPGIYVSGGALNRRGVWGPPRSPAGPRQRPVGGSGGQSPPEAHDN